MAQGEGGERKASGVRLTPDEVRAIKDSAREAFGESAVVRLFGSRVDDNERGGDIDLLIEVDEVQDELRQKWSFEERFWSLTEPRKVDVLVAVRGKQPGPFERIAYRDGVVL